MLILGVEFSWRAERVGRNWQKPAVWAFAAVMAYIGLNAAISARASAATRLLVERVAQPQMIVAGEVPLEFWKRQVLWRSDKFGGAADYDAFRDFARLDPKIT